MGAQKGKDLLLKLHDGSEFVTVAGLRGRKIAFNAETVDVTHAESAGRWRELLEGDPTKSRIYKDIGNGVATAGIEYYLPLFFEQTATVFDYLGADATLVLHGDLEPAFQRFWQDTRERYRLVQGDPERPARGARVPAPASPGSAASGCTGAELYRSDGEFLVRESARADAIRIELQACYAAYERARGVVNAVGP